MREQELVYSVAVGVADKASGRPATVETLYEIGSVGKMLSVGLLARLHEHGTVRIHDPIRRWLPEGIAIAEQRPEITLWHLATHTSGLPANPVNVSGFPRLQWRGYSEQDLYAGLRETQLTHEPGLDLVYSNLGVGLLRHLLSVAAGRPQDVLLEEELLRPLGMKVTGPATRLTARQRAVYATGYETAASTIPAPVWEHGCLDGCGSEVSSVPDLARFVSFQLTGSGRQGRLLTEATRKQLHRPQWMDPDWQSGIALGWFLERTDGREVVAHHRGRAAGHCAYIGLMPERDLGVVVLANVGGRQPSRDLLALGLRMLDASVPAAVTEGDDPAELFSDDFESGLGQWEISDASAITAIDSGNPQHGRVMRLAPAHARLHALIRGSERWERYRLEGEVLFPEDEHNYLGFIYNYGESDGRVDLGSIYIKGNGSYLQANPRRDWNPGRALYPEYHIDLEGDEAIVIGRWHRFAAEVMGSDCHFYVGDMKTPKVTFDLFEYETGRAGFKPRVVGGPVWLDNVRVVGIDGFSYGGPALPARLGHDASGVVTGWRVIGPFTHAVHEIEVTTPTLRHVEVDGTGFRWRRLECDERGAVVTAREIDFLGPRTVAYFATTIDVSPGPQAMLHLSTIDDLALWLNGVFEGYLEGDRRAWHDAGVNPDHPATDTIPLEAGRNHIMVRIRGGRYASGGFFARLVLGGP